MAEKWPRLSQTLTGPRKPGVCQSCGREDLPVIYWMEADDNDKFSPLGWNIVPVGLCHACSDRLIEPHPRLYEQIERYKPIAGLLPMCVKCKHAFRLDCRSPLHKKNGGDGIKIEYPEPFVAHVDGSVGPKGGRRAGWTIAKYEPATGCDGYEETK